MRRSSPVRADACGNLNGYVMPMQSYVYIMTNKTHGVLYTGVTSDLVKRVYQHREHMFPGFTKKYRVHKLVYYEVFDDIRNAIIGEKQIKDGPRQRKINLIAKMNPEWIDLFEEIM